MKAGDILVAINGKEVGSAAGVVDEIGTDGLVLLNETFQTTAYEEGAQGLYHILRYLAEGDNRWMLTTHLTDLSAHFTAREVTLLRTDADHRVRPI